ncbi:phosphoribosylanthranilate isomerase [Winogradskyella psychrotolerans]|uniref:phosphoribosylanthranilate isomerase n=1 Tax=Winogradskyella psychrotolerans TaxID=1344585 RepID=UPI001C07B792|nr:phosphoribosylanthranilate isomerase [Winogradskyella psychrotolerans]MBU2927344.1 phosphoribosylanthranilate isomerase [Winogradskyella psychrotolerans]
MKLKICGMKFKDNIEAVASLQPDFLGFIFYDKSARNFDSIIPDIPTSIKKVGVFVDETLETVKEKIEKYNLQAVQLHGQESPEFCAAIDHVEVIKVFSIKDEFNFEVLQPYEAVCDYFLFDTKGKLPGGNGFTFNWNVLKNYPSTKPYFLSGGIGLYEIEKIKEFKESPASNYCYAIDVNSKFEIEPGLKNIEKLKKFITQLSFRT